jgi:hypothetical protein
MQIIAAIAAANARDQQAQHVFDDGPQLGWQLAAADVAITDISAMVYDRLATGKAIVVTRPVSSEADVDEDGFLGSADWLTAEAAPDVLAVLDRVQNDPDARKNLQFWAERHFGDTTPGAATRRFHDAVERLMAEWERNAALHIGDRPDHAGDGADDEDDEGMPGT